jgi:hypothetical protein
MDVISMSHVLSYSLIGIPDQISNVFLFDFLFYAPCL